MSDRGPVRYVALYVSDVKTFDDSIVWTCVGLFPDVADAFTEGRVRVEQGYGIQIEPGEMSQAEWDDLEDADDFAPSVEGERI